MSLYGLHTVNTPVPFDNPAEPIVAKHLSELSREDKKQLYCELTRLHNLINSALVRDRISRLNKKSSHWWVKQEPQWFSKEPEWTF